MTYHSVFFMENHDCWDIFSNPYYHQGSKAEYLISTWLIMDKKHLTFQINALFYAQA